MINYLNLLFLKLDFKEREKESKENRYILNITFVPHCIHLLSISN